MFSIRLLLYFEKCSPGILTQIFMIFRILQYNYPNNDNKKHTLISIFIELIYVKFLLILKLYEANVLHFHSCLRQTMVQIPMFRYIIYNKIIDKKQNRIKYMIINWLQFICTTFC